MNKIVILMTLIVLAGKIGNAQKKFACPIKDSKASLEKPNTTDFEVPSKVLLIKCNGCAVYSSSNGIVEKIDTLANKALVVDVSFNNYIFTYYNIQNLTKKKGDKIKAGQKLGYIVKGEDLKLLILKDENYIIPLNVIKCK